MGRKRREKTGEALESVAKLFPSERRVKESEAIKDELAAIIKEVNKKFPDQKAADVDKIKIDEAGIIRYPDRYIDLAAKVGKADIAKKIGDNLHVNQKSRYFSFSKKTHDEKK